VFWEVCGIGRYSEAVCVPEEHLTHISKSCVFELIKLENHRIREPRSDVRNEVNISPVPPQVLRERHRIKPSSCRGQISYFVGVKRNVSSRCNNVIKGSSVLVVSSICCLAVESIGIWGSIGEVSDLVWIEGETRNWSRDAIKSSGVEVVTGISLGLG
jgi:hypothetical protein